MGGARVPLGTVTLNVEPPRRISYWGKLREGRTLLGNVASRPYCLTISGH